MAWLYMDKDSHNALKEIITIKKQEMAMRPILRNSLIASFLTACGWVAWDMFEDHQAETTNASAVNQPGPGQVAQKEPLVFLSVEAIVATIPTEEIIEKQNPQEMIHQTENELRACWVLQDAKKSFGLFQQTPVDDYQKWKYLSEAAKTESAVPLPQEDVSKLLSFYARIAVKNLAQQIQADPHNYRENSTRYFRIALLLENDASADIGLPHAEAEVGITKDFARKEFYRLAPLAEQQAWEEFRNFPADTLIPDSPTEKRYLELYSELNGFNPRFNRGDGNYAVFLWERARMTPEQAENFFSRAYDIIERKRLEREDREKQIKEEDVQSDPKIQLMEVRQLLQECRGPR